MRPGNSEDDCLLRWWMFESTGTNQIVATYDLIYHPAVSPWLYQGRSGRFSSLLQTNTSKEMAPNPQCTAIAAAMEKNGSLPLGSLASTSLIGLQD